MTALYSETQTFKIEPEHDFAPLQIYVLSN